MSGIKILLVEDEKNFGIVMRDYLKVNGYDVCWCENGLTGLSKFEQEKFELCIADVMMPGMDGFTLVEEIRKRDTEIPVLFLTARSMREDMLKGYQSGADDYIIKPFDTELLLLKISAMLRRKQNDSAAHDEFRFGSFTYNHSLRQLNSKNRNEKLSPKESELLYMLLKNANRPVAKSLLLQRIWKNDTYFAGRSMDVYIVKLRRYLEADKKISIQNIHGSGYCLKVD